MPERRRAMGHSSRTNSKSEKNSTLMPGRAMLGGRVGVPLPGQTPAAALLPERKARSQWQKANLEVDRAKFGTLPISHWRGLWFHPDAKLQLAADRRGALWRVTPG